MVRKWSLVALLGLLVPWSDAAAAEMSVRNLRMRPNRSAKVLVSGSIDGGLTFGWTIMLELIPRERSRGTVTFTPVAGEQPYKRPSFVVVKNVRGIDAVQIEEVSREGVDVRQLSDAWPGIGAFTPYDTIRAGSDTLNGAVDDNGTYLADALTFSGTLALFPVVASPNARGVWDVALWTQAGESGWEQVETTLVGGTISVSRRACRKDRDCNDRDPCTDDTCDAGVCVHVRNEHACHEAEQAKKRMGKKR